MLIHEYITLLGNSVLKTNMVECWTVTNVKLFTVYTLSQEMDTLQQYCSSDGQISIFCSDFIERKGELLFWIFEGESSLK